MLMGQPCLPGGKITLVRLNARSHKNTVYELFRSTSVMRLSETNFTPVTFTDGEYGVRLLHRT
jgi:hypothetical protein